MPFPGLYKPPAPKPCKPLRGLRLLRVFWTNNILNLIPEEFFHADIKRIYFTRRPTYLVNSPDLVNAVLVEKRLSFPKSDIMVESLKPVIGDTTIVASGPKWEEQKEMIAPVFSQGGMESVFKHAHDASSDFLRHLEQVSKFDKSISLREEMSHVTADTIFRAIFSVPVDGQRARNLFELVRSYHAVTAAWARKAILRNPAGSALKPLPLDALELRDRIRERIIELFEEYIEGREGEYNDICQRLVNARHPQTGATFSHEQLIDQIATFFLAGHETTSSALSWAFYILSQRPDYADRIRRETDDVTNGESIEYHHLPKLRFTYNVFRETLRLYPPVTFLTRMASEEMEIGGETIARGSLVVISPWVMHRHRSYWNKPDYFDPDRFDRNDEPLSGGFMPFGLGPRVCSGANMATVKAILLLARLTRYFSFKVTYPEEVFPDAGVSLHTTSEIKCKLVSRMHLSEEPLRIPVE